MHNIPGGGVHCIVLCLLVLSPNRMAVKRLAARHGLPVESGGSLTDSLAFLSIKVLL